MDNVRVSFWARLGRATVWHPDAIPADAAWKYRWGRRIWLPLYDLIVVGGGLWATAFGSPILHRIFDEGSIDVAGILFAIAGTLAFFGVIFPSLLAVEILGKLGIVGLIATYSAAVLFFRSNPDPEAGFVVFMLALTLIGPFSRLTDIGETIKQRRAEDATDAEGTVE